MNHEGIQYKIIKSKHGFDTIIVTSKGREMPLHSKVNPEHEFRSFVDKFDPERFDVLIVLGIGLGYHLIPLPEYLNRYSRIILIDILSGIDEAIGKNPLTSFLLKSALITFVSGKTIEEAVAIVSEIIDMNGLRGISVLEHPASTRIFHDYYGSIKNSIEKQINRMAGNRATKKAFGALYLRNILKNIALLDDFKPVEHLFGAFKKYPAVIIAPGPCLERDIQNIKKHEHGFFIVSVDSALPVLNGYGIPPDIVISIDPQPYVCEHFLNCDTGHAIGIVSLSSHPGVLKRLPGYISLNSHPLSQFASRVYGDSIGSVDSGTGSVAGDAVKLCLKCGFSSIGLAGLDLSFSDYKIYSRGTAYQKRYSVYFQDRLSTVESYNCRYILHASKGLRREGKYTRKSFLQYRESLENFVKSSGADNILALNDCGIALSGIRITSLEEFAAVECKSTIDKKSIISSLIRDSRLLESGPMISGLDEILHDRLFDELIAASLSGQVDEKTKSRYRKMIESLHRGQPGE